MDVKLFALFANDEDEGFRRDGSKIGMSTDEMGMEITMRNDSCQRSQGGVDSLLKLVLVGHLGRLSACSRHVVYICQS